MHVDPDVLGLLALGEEAGTDDDHTHLQTCDDCARELGELQQLVTLGRTVSPEPMDVPAPAVWARIRDELHLDPQLEVGSRAPESSESRAESPRPPNTFPAVASRTETPRRRRRSLLRFLRATVNRTSHHEPVAHAQLSPVEAFWSHASGTAALATDAQGRRVLQLDLEADLPSSGLRQAWLIHRDDPNRRQTVGILDGLHGVWTIDHSIDLHSYAILEISQQGTGESVYSGDSIVRGELNLTS